MAKDGRFSMYGTGVKSGPGAPTSAGVGGGPASTAGPDCTPPNTPAGPAQVPRSMSGNSPLTFNGAMAHSPAIPPTTEGKYMVVRKSAAGANQVHENSTYRVGESASASRTTGLGTSHNLPRGSSSPGPYKNTQVMVLRLNPDLVLHHPLHTKEHDRSAAVEVALINEKNIPGNNRDALQVANLGAAIFQNGRMVTVKFTLADIISKIQNGADPATVLTAPLFLPAMFPRVVDLLADTSSAGANTVDVSKVHLLDFNIDCVDTTFPLAMGVNVPGTQRKQTNENNKEYTAFVSSKVNTSMHAPIPMSGCGDNIDMQTFATYFSYDADDLVRISLSQAEREAVGGPGQPMQTSYIVDYILAMYFRDLCEIKGENSEEVKALKEPGQVWVDRDHLQLKGVAEFVHRLGASFKATQDRMNMYDVQNCRVAFEPLCANSWQDCLGALRDVFGCTITDHAALGKMTFTMSLACRFTWIAPCLSLDVQNKILQLRKDFLEEKAASAPTVRMPMVPRVPMQGGGGGQEMGQMDQAQMQMVMQLLQALQAGSPSGAQPNGMQAQAGMGAAPHSGRGDRHRSANGQYR